ncbi:unnamed protein product [Choristocarpus tenellus]
MGEGHTPNPPMVTVRRLRVTTVQTDASMDVPYITEMLDPPAVMSVLVHKVTAEARRSGLVEARSLLRDWLANFLYGVVQSKKKTDIKGESGEEGGGEEGAGGALDAVLAKPWAWAMVQQVYGLLHSPLMHPTGGCPDSRACLQAVLCSLDPRCLVIAIYPEMQGYASVNMRLSNQMALSRESLTRGRPPCNIFVVDAFRRVVVHFADPNLPPPLPPTTASQSPHSIFGNTGLGQFLQVRSKARPDSGEEVILSQTGTPQEYFFEELLLDDHPLPDESHQTLDGFLEGLRHDVMEE